VNWYNVRMSKECGAGAQGAESRKQKRYSSHRTDRRKREMQKQEPCITSGIWIREAFGVLY
jgi:hypothetical protein